MTDIEQASLDFYSSFYEFYRYFAWPHISQDTYVDNWHVRAICEELELYKDAILKREYIEDLVVNIPPGSSKSSIISQSFPVWLWLHDPSVSVIVSSYSSGLSTDHSIKAKQILQSSQFEIFFKQLYENLHGKALVLRKDNEAFWSNNFGGQFITTSTGGTITGRHAHLIIRDDPINPEQAESDTYRAKANRFNDRTLSTRKKNKDCTPTITVMQRVHEDDTTGHELSKKIKIKHINLPAELTDKVSPQEWAEYYEDGLLDVRRMSRGTLGKIKKDLGTYGYSGQFLQEPYPEEGGRIKKDWFCYLNYSELPPNLVWDLWIDGAYTENTKNDPSGLMISAHDVVNNRIIVRYFKGEYLILPRLVKAVMALEYGIDAASMVYVEPKASGLSLIQEIRDKSAMNVTRIVGKLVQAGKEARLNTSSPKIEGSRVWLVRGNWNEAFVMQHTGFPNVSHDEAVDLLGYACRKYFY